MPGKVLIIGSDSFIAQKFIEKNYKNFSMRGFARTKTTLEHEKVLDDFFKIQETDFINIDSVLNFAAIVHQPQITNSNLYHEINHRLTVENARKAKNAGVRQFVQMSTIAVYGETNNININCEENPENEYGKSKKLADDDLLALQNEYFKVAIVRPPMVYGGGNAPGNMMRLLKLANTGLPLPFKNINNQKDFININNLIQYLFIILIKELNGIFLITDRESKSSEDIIKTIEKFQSKKVPCFSIPMFFLKFIKLFRPAEYEKVFGSLTIESNFPHEELINRESFAEGIREMVEWLMTNKKTIF